MTWLYVITLFVLLTRSDAGTIDLICSVFPKLDLARATLTTPGDLALCDTNGGDWCVTQYNDPYCIDGCKQDAVSCVLDQSLPINYNYCDKRCRWCYNQPVPEMRCQANHYECMMDDRIPVGSSTPITANEYYSYWRGEVYVTKNDCESLGGYFCPNPEYNYYHTEKVYLPWCIKPQPSLAGCFKQSPTPCSTYHDNEFDCHFVGCVWCNNARNPAKCIAAAPSSCPEHTCCEDHYCIATEYADKWECLNKGCQYCEINGKKLCRLGNSLQCYVPEKDNCFYDGSNVDASKEMCDSFPNCRWCPLYDDPNCFIEHYPAVCYTVQTECKKRGIKDPKTCKLWGCEWCGRESNVSCIESTTCTDCDCRTRVSCDADTPEKCQRKMCKWCNETSECININSEGVCEFNTSSPCTTDCGCGTSFVYDPSCTDSNILNCPRIYSNCNTHECAEECPEGLMKRYKDPGMCCMSHTKECGRNTLNDMCSAYANDTETGHKRKKRVTNGEDILSITKWPWLALLLHPQTTCGAVIISKTHVLTSAFCFISGFPISDYEIYLGTYDSNQPPTYTSGIANMTIVDDIAVIQLDSPPANFESRVSPICMPRTERAPFGKKCIVAGWGSNNYNLQVVSSIAKDAMVKIVPWHICKDANPSGSTRDDETHVCASIFPGGGNACIFDFGGPLMCQRCENCAWYLEGIIIHAQCELPNTGTIFARVSYYEDQIATITAATEYGSYTCCPKKKHDSSY